MSTRSNQRLISHLKTIADKKDVSLYKLSREIGVTPGALTMIANGQRAASPAVLVALCDKLDCKVEDLIEVIPAV